MRSGLVGLSPEGGASTGASRLPDIRLHAPWPWPRSIHAFPTGTSSRCEVLGASCGRGADPARLWSFQGCPSFGAAPLPRWQGVGGPGSTRRGDYRGAVTFAPWSAAVVTWPLRPVRSAPWQELRGPTCWAANLRRPGGYLGTSPCPPSLGWWPRSFGATSRPSFRCQGASPPPAASSWPGGHPHRTPAAAGVSPPPIGTPRPDL